MAEQANLMVAMTTHLAILRRLEGRDLRTAKEISEAWRRHFGPRSGMLSAPHDQAAFLQMPIGADAEVTAAEDGDEEIVDGGGGDEGNPDAHAPVGAFKLVRIPLETLGITISSRNHAIKSTPLLDVRDPRTPAIAALHLAMASRRLHLAQNAADSRADQLLVIPIWECASSQFRFLYEIMCDPSALREQDWWRTSFGAADGGTAHETARLTEAQRHAPWTIPFTRKLAQDGVDAHELRWPCWDVSRPRRVMVSPDGAVTFHAAATPRGLVRGLKQIGRLTGDLTQPSFWSRARGWSDINVGKSRMDTAKAAELLYGRVSARKGDGDDVPEFRVWPAPCVSMAIADAVGADKSAWYANDPPSHFYLVGVQYENGKVHATPELVVPAFRHAEGIPGGGVPDARWHSASRFTSRPSRPFPRESDQRESFRPQRMDTAGSQISQLTTE